MYERVRYLVPTLALIAGGRLAAVETNPNLFESGGNQHYLQGSLLVDVLKQNRVQLSPDDKTEGLWVRAEYGAKIELDDKIELTMTVGYNGRAGTKPESATTNEDGEVVIDDAWVVFKRFAHPALDIELGRMPVSWNLRADHGAFLFDSRANDNAVTSWDGMRASIDLDTWTLRPFYYWLDLYNDHRGDAPGGLGDQDYNYLYGILVDWQPESAVDNDIFITASYTIERNAWFGQPGAFQSASRIETWTLGTEWKLTSGWDLYGEFAQQKGDLGGGQDIDALGYYGGLVWHVPVGGRLDKASVGLQYDNFSGDSGGSAFEGFINPHEAVSDTMIVEHERYGELSELLVGNLEAYKTRIEWIFVPEMNMRMQVTGAFYNMPQPPGANDEFGQEYDLIFAWDYNYYSTITLHGAWFTPGKGYRDLTGSDDDVTSIGMSVLVEF